MNSVEWFKNFHNLSLSLKQIVLSFCEHASEISLLDELMTHTFNNKLKQIALIDLWKKDFILALARPVIQNEIEKRIKATSEKEKLDVEIRDTVSKELTTYHMCQKNVLVITFLHFISPRFPSTLHEYLAKLEVLDIDLYFAKIAELTKTLYNNYKSQMKLVSYSIGFDNESPDIIVIEIQTNSSNPFIHFKILQSFPKQIQDGLHRNRITFFVCIRPSISTL